jgi:hypothetical protein
MSNYRIYISIISYRDSETVATLNSLYDHSHIPANLIPCICWQYNPSEDSEKLFHSNKFSETAAKYSANIRQLFLHSSKARGPVYARALIEQNLFYGVDERISNYFLQLDSHMRFIIDWDRHLLQQIALCEPQNYSILTNYPINYDFGRDSQINYEKLEPPTLLVADSFHLTDGILRIKGKQLSSALGTPIPSLFIAAGFLFAPLTLLRCCPTNPNLMNLFFGEENYSAARYFTHGFSFFTTQFNIAYHLWNRNYRPNFREIEKITTDKEILSRIIIKTVLNQPIEAESRYFEQNHTEIDSQFVQNSIKSYGLGGKCSLEAYFHYCGVDFSLGRVERRAQEGGIDRKIHSFMQEKQEKQLDFILNLVNRYK